MGRAVKGRLLIVELVGLPGSGKTTVATAVARVLAARGIQSLDRRALANGGHGRFRAYADAARYHLSNAGSVAAALQLAWSVRPRARDAAAHALRIADWAHRLARVAAGPHDLVVLDHGVVQTAWSSVLTAVEWDGRALGAAVRHGLESADATYALVHLELDAETALARLRGRVNGRSRLDAMADAEARAVLASGAPKLRQLVDYAVALTGTTSFPTDGTQTVAATTEQVVGFIASLRNGGAPPA